MENKTDKTLDILRVIRGPKDQVGLKIIRVNTADPAPITLVFEGTPLPLDLEVFEIPVSCYPLRKDDRLLAFPLVGNENGQRWAALTKLNGGVIMATMTGATSCQVEGIGREYVSQDLIIPPYFAVNDVIRPLQTGDRVSLLPTLEGLAIKYVILQRY